MCTYTLDWTSHKLINQQNQNQIYANHNKKTTHWFRNTSELFFFFFFKSSGASHSLTYKRRSVHYSSLFAKQGKSQSFKEIGKKKDESLEPPSLTAPRSLFLFPLRPQERRGKKDTLGNPSQSLSHSILNIRRVIKKFND